MARAFHAGLFFAGLLQARQRFARVHGVALAPDLGRGFTTNGGTDTSTIVDLKTLKKIGIAMIDAATEAHVAAGRTRGIVRFARISSNSGSHRSAVVGSSAPTS